MAAVVCNASVITDDMFLVAARSLADQVSSADLEAGSLYPPLSAIRKISRKIAADVVKYAYQHGLAQRDLKQETIEEAISNYMFDPSY